MPTPRGPDTDKRCDERKEAEQMYLNSKGSMKLVEIAEKLKLPDTKIRKWKSLDNWESKLHPGKKDSKKKQVERSTSEQGSVPRKRGAPKGNKNAQGCRGNPYPKPPIKHGGYSAIFWDTLDDDEKELLETLPKDEEQLLLEQIQLFSIRERRIMLAINRYREMKSPVAVAFSQRSERKRTFADKEEEEEYKRRVDEAVANEKRMPGQEYAVFTQTDNKDSIITRLEAELSNVQAKKTKAIEALAKLHIENRKLDGDSSGNEIAREWAERVRRLRGGLHE